MINLTLQILFLSQLSSALPNYYGKNLLTQPEMRDTQLKEALFLALNSVHAVNPNQPDDLGKSCPAQKKCYQHQAIGYKGARKTLFGDLDLKGKPGQYYLYDVYCERAYTAADFPKNGGPDRGKIPSDHIMNIEHIWPQSRFNGKFPDGLQKSDLHHLQITSAAVNSLRGNSPFGEVADVKSQTCKYSALGYQATNAKTLIFLPPEAIRGDVARALFYFSIRYRLSIDPTQESTLKKWHQIDPVNPAERTRAEEIFQLQGSRNPFIDQPNWVDQITDF